MAFLICLTTLVVEVILTYFNSMSPLEVHKAVEVCEVRKQKAITNTNVLGVIYYVKCES